MLQGVGLKKWIENIRVVFKNVSKLQAEAYTVCIRNSYEEKKRAAKNRWFAIKDRFEEHPGGHQPSGVGLTTTSGSAVIHTRDGAKPLISSTKSLALMRFIRIAKSSKKRNLQVARCMSLKPMFVLSKGTITKMELEYFCVEE